MGETTMTFAAALYYMKKGRAVKRIHWLGYWVLEGNELRMYCKDGRIVTLHDCDTVFTLDNVAAEDWVVVSDELRAELDKIRESGVLAGVPTVAAAPDGK